MALSPVVGTVKLRNAASIANSAEPLMSLYAAGAATIPSAPALTAPAGSGVSPSFVPT